AERDRADRQPERVLLGDARGPPGLALHLLSVRRGVRDAVPGAGDLLPDAADRVLHGVDLPLDVLLGALLDVGLVSERVDGLPHLLPGLLYLVADPARVLAHRASSFTVSMVCSGTGGPAFWKRSRPVMAS